LDRCQIRKQRDHSLSMGPRGTELPPTGPRGTELPPTIPRGTELPPTGPRGTELPTLPLFSVYIFFPIIFFYYFISFSLI